MLGEIRAFFNMKKIYKSTIGNILLESDGELITKCEFVQMDSIDENDTDFVLNQAVEYLNDYFEGKNVGEFEKVKFAFTDYQNKILKIVHKIKYANTLTYSDVKNQYEQIYHKKTSPRAVGKAIGKNTIAIFIPCHRVVGKGNKLTGYKYGMDKKKFLLELEQKVL